MIVIRSVDRNANSASSSNCQFTLGNGNTFRFGEHKMARLESLTCFNYPYTIQSGVNDTVDFNENSTNKSCTLTPGYYNGSTLAAELASQLTTTSATYNTYTVSYSTATHKMTISAGNAFTLKFSTGTNTAKSPWRELGFVTGSGVPAAVDSSTATSVTSPYPINLGLPLSWFVDIQQFSSCDLNQTTYSGNGFTFYVPMTEMSGNIMQFSVNSQFDQRVELPARFTNQFTVVFRSVSGSALSLMGGEWEMVLRLL